MIPLLQGLGQLIEEMRRRADFRGEEGSDEEDIHITTIVEYKLFY